MSLETNKAIIQRYQEAYNTGNLDALDEILDPGLISHSLIAGMPPGPRSAKWVHKGILKTFPDVHYQIDDLIAEADKVVARFTVTGTHEGTYQGAPGTGKKFKVTGISIFRIANGKIVEHWANQNELGLRQQLGLAS